MAIKEEKLIEISILRYLNTLPGCYAYKVNNTGTFSTQADSYLTRRNKYEARHPSDILCFYRGRCIAIEVKTPKELLYIMKHYDRLRMMSWTDSKRKRYQGQIIYLENVNKSGNVGFFSDSLEDVRHKFRSLGITPIGDSYDQRAPDPREISNGESPSSEGSRPTPARKRTTPKKTRVL